MSSTIPPLPPVNPFRRLFRTFILPALLLATTSVTRADHRGATGVINDPATNINEVYAFVDPANPSMVVLAMTVNGYSPSGINPVFSPDALYQFKIDNTGDFVEDLVIQVYFDRPTGDAFAPVQNYTVVGPVKPPRIGGVNTVARIKTPPFTGLITNVPVTGPGAGTAVNTFNTFAGNISVFCGVRDDCFTFDEIFVRKILRGTLAAPNPANVRNPGIDYYARFNCSTIVIELPATLLTGTLANDLAHKQLNIWATTSLPSAVTRVLRAPKKLPPSTRQVNSKTFVQHDRVAHPCVGTFLINDEDKAAFAQGQPKNDAEFFTGQATEKIKKLQLDPTSQASISALANLLAIRFPDVLRLDVTSTSGFDTIDFSGQVPKDGNARRPQDDVISFELGLLTVGVVTNEGIPGSNGRVGGNDATFVGGSSTTIGLFPFFAPPHVPAEPVPARN